MRKVLFIILMLSSVCFAKTYRVSGLRGEAVFLNGEKLEPIQINQELTEGTYIYTSVGTFLKLKDSNGKLTTIGPRTSGTLSILIERPKIFIGSKIAESNVKAETTGTSKGTATASARASEAKEDIDWNDN